jgi:hypothetical protein
MIPTVPPSAPPHAVTRFRLLASLGLLLTLLAGPVGAAPPDFEAPYVAYESGSKCGDVVPADLDGDGHLDLVIATTNPAAVTVRLGTAEGTFPTSRVVSLGGTGVTTFSLADLNSDGHLDLIANNSPAFSFQYRFGDGLGGCGPPQSMSTGAAIASDQAADFNEDGWLTWPTPDRVSRCGSAPAAATSAPRRSIPSGSEHSSRRRGSDATAMARRRHDILHVGSTMPAPGGGTTLRQFSTIATASTDPSGGHDR